MIPITFLAPFGATIKLGSFFWLVKWHKLS
jgi:hypothetical protein